MEWMGLGVGEGEITPSDPISRGGDAERQKKAVSVESKGQRAGGRFSADPAESKSLGDVKCRERLEP